MEAYWETSAKGMTYNVGLAILTCNQNTATFGGKLKIKIQKGKKYRNIPNTATVTANKCFTRALA